MRRKGHLAEVPCCGSLDRVTKYIPAPSLVGAVGYHWSAYSEASKYVKKPWNYLRKEMVRGRCCITQRPDDKFLVITNRFTAVVDNANYDVLGVYPTNVKLVRRDDMCE